MTVADMDEGGKKRLVLTMEAFTLAHSHAADRGFGKGNFGIGEIECPICNKRLRYRVAALNGHMHAACETEGCVRWME